VKVRIANAGVFTWPAAGGDRPAVNIAYRWVRENGSNVPGEAERTPLPFAVPPAGEISLLATVIAPNECGRFTLKVSPVNEGDAWFIDKGVAPAEQVVQVI
jgi:O-antigen biosynthesis protein